MFRIFILAPVRQATIFDKHISCPGSNECVAIMNCRIRAARIWAQARTARLHRWRREQIASLCATASPWKARLETAKGIKPKPSGTKTVQQLSHIDNMLPGMVDVTDKEPGKRRAVAEAFVELPKSVREVLASRDENDTDDIATLKVSRTLIWHLVRFVHAYSSAHNCVVHAACAGPCICYCSDCRHASCQVDSFTHTSVPQPSCNWVSDRLLAV